MSSKITKRQRSVLLEQAASRSPAELAQELGLSEEIVRRELRRLADRKHAPVPRSQALGDVLDAHWWLVLLGIFGGALVLRLLHLQQIRANDPFFYAPSVDPRVYHEWAMEISGGDWLGDEVFFNSPLYPYFLGLIYAAVGPSLTAARVVQCAIGGVTCVLTAQLGLRLFGPVVGAIAGCIGCVYGMSVFYEGVLLITNIQTPLTLVTVLLLLRASESPSSVRWLAAGAMIGLSALARPNALLIALFALLGGWLALRDRLEAPRLLGLAAAFAVGVALMVAPVTLRNWIVGDDWVLVNAQGGVNFYVGNNAGAWGGFMVPRVLPRNAGDDPREQRQNFGRLAEEAEGRSLKPSEVSSYWFGEGLAFLREHPGRAFALALRKVEMWFNHKEVWNNRSYEMSERFSWVLRLPLLGFGLVAPLGVLGLGLSFGDWRRFWPVYAVLVANLLSLVLFFVLSRYRMPVVPLLMVFAAAFLVWLAAALRARSAERLVVAGMALLALGWFVNRTTFSQGTSMAHYNLGNKYREAGHLEQAVEEYKRTISGSPDYISAHNNLASTYAMRPEWRELAIRQWEIVRRMGQERGDRAYVDRAERNLRQLRAASEEPGAGSDP